ncbi:hypothetical protein SAMN05216326_16011 [Nitrosomonas marina]|uniref:Uncharacterized protein n=1 Tax=Nitrosomonas marina TaxID=917 RepID=A0A1I0GCE6_9PROT|nr:hypothetical protein SAMN05216326_16011 [Nitrosomonas marina]
MLYETCTFQTYNMSNGTMLINIVCRQTKQQVLLAIPITSTACAQIQ